MNANVYAPLDDFQVTRRYLTEASHSLATATEHAVERAADEGPALQRALELIDVIENAIRAVNRI